VDKLLTVRKKKWVKQFKPDQVRGTPLNYNAAIQERYMRELVSMVKQMTSQTQRELVKLYKTETMTDYFGEDSAPTARANATMNKLIAKFTDLFATKADALAQRMIEQTDQASSTSLQLSLKQLSGGLTLNTDVITGPMAQVLKAGIAENVSLIKSIPSRYLSGVQQALNRSITTARGSVDLIPYLQKHEGITIRRARMIALDQTRKAYSNITSSRLQKLGVKKFEWLHTAGSNEPRKLHIEYSGKIFSFDDPPIIDENTGERGLPGQAINCRCRMAPVISFEGE
jgi:SPP1 gp7 family putative phage head morphogenesis protein